MSKAMGARRWLWLSAGLLVAAVCAYPAWRTVRATWWLSEARRCLDASRPEDALAALTKVDRLQTGRADVHYLLAVASRRAGKLGQMSSYLDRAEQLSWPLEDIERQRALAVIQMGDMRTAAPFVDDLLNHRLSDTDAQESYEALSRGYLAAYRLLDATVCLEHWLAWRPDAVQPRIWLAEIWEARDQSTKAATLYREVLAIDPDHFQARSKLALALSNDQKVTEALAEYEQCYAAAPDDPGVLLGMANCMERMGNTEAAKKFLEAVRDSKGENRARSQALLSLGRMALKQGKTEEAIALVRQAIEIEPRESSTHYVLGMALAKLGATEEAKREIQRSRELQEGYDELVRTSHKVAQEPDNPELRWQVGDLYRRIGLLREAAAWFKSALLTDPQHRKSHESLAAYYEDQKTGDVRLAAYHRHEAEQIAMAEAAAMDGAGDPPSGAIVDPDPSPPEGPLTPESRADDGNQEAAAPSGSSAAHQPAAAEPRRPGSAASREAVAH
jgi:tetratricopeptide (TPR) repeat protein